MEMSLDDASIARLSLAVRVVVTLVASGLLALVLPGSLSVQTRALVVWNGAVLVFLGLIVAMIIGTTPDQVRDSARESAMPGRGCWSVAW